MTKTPNESIRFSVSVPEPIYEKIRLIAFKRRISIAKAVRILLESAAKENVK